MHTKSLTATAPVPVRSRPIAVDTGRADLIDEHPLMRCTPTVLGGHAHLKRNEVPVERVLEALLRERKHAPLRVGKNVAITDDEVRAVIAYSVAIFNDISRLYAELDRRLQLANGGAK